MLVQKASTGVSEFMIIMLSQHFNWGWASWPQLIWVISSSLVFLDLSCILK